jgi:hypothetical protein
MEKLYSEFFIRHLALFIYTLSIWFFFMISICLFNSSFIVCTVLLNSFSNVRQFSIHLFFIHVPFHFLNHSYNHTFEFFYLSSSSLSIVSVCVEIWFCECYISFFLWGGMGTGIQPRISYVLDKYCITRAVLSTICCLFICYDSTGVWTKALMEARQILCCLSHASSPVYF